MSWNPVVNLFNEVKENFISKFGEDNLWDYNTGTSLEYWMRALGGYEDFLNQVRMTEYKNLILIKYNDLGVEWNDLMRECRSVVLDTAVGELVLAPFRKFFNINEKEETQLSIIEEKLANAQLVEITDKLDGSMVSTSWYRGELVVAGSSSLNPVNSFRLAHYYDWFEKNENAAQLIRDFAGFTLIWESIWKEDTHIVQYDADKQGLYLIGMRSKYDGNMVPYNTLITIAEHYHVPHTTVYDMSFDEAHQSIMNNEYAANEREGFVIRIDNDFYKFKYSDYILLHHTIGKMVSSNTIINAIATGRYDDFISQVPVAYQPQVQEVADNVIKYMNLMDDIIESYLYMIPSVSYSNRKESMTWITNNVPKQYQGRVRQMYLGQNVDYLTGVKYYQMLEVIS